MLDPDQKRAAYCGSPNLFIKAPAGSGKTRVLVERVAWLIKKQEVRADQILVLTFARKAALEIRARLKKRGFGDVEAQTFHAWAYGLARSIHTSAPRLINDEERRRLWRRLFIALLARGQNAHKIKEQAHKLNWSLTYLANELISVLEVLRQFGWTQEKTAAAIRNKKIEWPFSQALLDLWRSYEELLINRQFFDFNFLIDFTRGYLIGQPNILASLRRRYRRILVDEVQDANAQELSLINLLAASDGWLTLVGDPRQAVYAWRGADPTALQSFARPFDRLALKTNYRSDKNIIDLVNNFYGQKTVAAKTAHRRPVYILHERYEELAVLRSLLKELKELGYANKDIMILARAHNPLRPIKIIRKEYSGLTLATVHAVKGLEAKVVILINCSNDRFGFPLPDRDNRRPLLEHLTRYDQAAEERRIFYVAMTRARDRLIFLADRERPSPYLKNVKKKMIKYVTF